MPRRAKHKPLRFDSECELAERVVGWLRANGWSVYQEIAHIDMVAQKGDVLWGIECKRALSLEVLSQSLRRHRDVNRSSIAVPYFNNCSTQRRAWVLGCRIARERGVGMLTVSKGADVIVDDVIESYRYKVRSLSDPEHRDKRTNRLDPWLVDIAKNFKPAGSAGGVSWSPFKGTCHRLLLHVRGHPGITLKEAVAGIEHHYAHDRSAIGALSRGIKNGYVPGITINDGALHAP